MRFTFPSNRSRPVSAKKKLPLNAISNTSDLRKMLINTIADVRSGAIDAKDARAITALSGTILNSVRLDLDFLRFKAANEAISADLPEPSLNLVSQAG
jgi:hypothetical protein